MGVKMISRQWLVKVRFFPLAFIGLSSVFTYWVTSWYMGIESPSDFLVTLPIAAHALTGTLIKGFMDTKQDKQ